MAGFIGVHIGAGNHSLNLKQDYLKLCRQACRKGAAVLAEGKTALCAAAEAVAILEDSYLTNAGLGSSLTWDGHVECDAGAMEGTRQMWGGTGAVSGVKNPCYLARSICEAQSKEGTLGRIPPCLLVGQGAKDWAKQSGICTVDPASLIHERSLKRHQQYRRKVSRHEKRVLRVPDQLDTVGAVCIDGLGHTAAVCSSGGIALKHSGRVGQAAIFGAGCWAEDCEKGRPSVACVTSGCGEHLIRTSLAQKLACAVKEQPSSNTLSSASVVNIAMTKGYLESEMLRGVEERFGGALVLVCSPEDGCGELMWPHSTSTMGVAYMEVHQQPKSFISTLHPEIQPGKGLVVGGATFQLPALPVMIVKPT